MKKQYEKPMFMAVEIQLNDLCVGSLNNNTVIPIHIDKLNERKKYKKSYFKGETCNMWDTDI